MCAIGSPEGHRLSEHFTTFLKGLTTKDLSGIFAETTEPEKVVKDADVVYTDVWASMGEEAEAEVRKKVLRPFQLNSELLKLAKPESVVMHCLPAHRGQEITDEVIDSPQSVIFDQAENRLHIAKAVLKWLIA
jgi:ornithine carbamoyltransferase